MRMRNKWVNHHVIVQRDVYTVLQNRGQRKSVQWFQWYILTHGKVHIGQIGKWLWCCTISFSDNSSNRTSYRESSSSGLGDMCSGPWGNSNWGNEQMPLTMQNTPLDNSIRYKSARGARLYGSNRQTWANPYGQMGKWRRCCATTERDNSKALRQWKSV